MLLAALELCYPQAEGVYVQEQWPLCKQSRIDALRGLRAPMGGSVSVRKQTQTKASTTQAKLAANHEKALVAAAKAILNKTAAHAKSAKHAAKAKVKKGQRGRKGNSREEGSVSSDDNVDDETPSMRRRR